MAENNPARSEVMIPVFVLLGRPSENTVKLKTVLQNKTAGEWGSGGGGGIIFVGKVAACSRVLNWRMKFN